MYGKALPITCMEEASIHVLSVVDLQKYMTFTIELKMGIICVFQ